MSEYFSVKDLLLIFVVVIGFHVIVRMVSRAVFRSWWEVKDEYLEERKK